MVMNAIYVFVAIFVVSASAAADSKYCYNQAVKSCNLPPKGNNVLPNKACNARYGGIIDIQGELQAFANHHLNRSFEYLLMSTHYANYEKNRPGFEKLLRDLSDSTWKDTIDLVKYMTKRGGEMDFNNVGARPRDEAGSYELYEFPVVAKALDIQKQLAEEAFHIHEAASKAGKKKDPAVAYFLEHEFIKRHSDTVHKLSGYTADLNSLLSGEDRALSLYLFDEYLLKQ